MHSVGSTNPGRRGGFYPNEYPIARGVLATAETVGRRGRLAQRLANVVGRSKCRGAAEMGRSPSGRQFCSGEKEGSAVGKTKRGKGVK